MEAPAPARVDDLRELMVRYQRGDGASVDQLIRQMSPALLRFFAAWGILREDSEDLLQECWVRVHRARHTYRPAEPVRPWIFAIARHTRLDAYRRKRRQVSREVLVSEAPENPWTGASESDDKFTQMLESLPDGQREVIVMLKGEEMSLEEVARATSSTVGAVKQKAHRAYEKLRGLLGKDQGL